MNDFSQHIGFYIQEIARRTSVTLNEYLKELSISYAQFRVINCLAKRGDLAQKSISNEIVVKASTLSGLLDLLEEKAYVEKKIADYDGRVRLVGLTEKGLLVWKKAYQIIEDFEGETTAHIPKDEKEKILDYLRVMNEKI